MTEYEAFLRRIGHKIYCGYVSREGYEQIWETVCDDRDVAFQPHHQAREAEAVVPQAKPVLPSIQAFGIVQAEGPPLKFHVY